MQDSNETPTICVLVVDDDVMTLATLKSVIGSHDDVSVEVAMNAGEALKLLESKSVHAIIADFNLVGPNGGLILRRVREDYPNVRRILFSGSPYAEISPQIDRALADMFLTKPIEIDALESILGSLRSQLG